MNFALPGLFVGPGRPHVPPQAQDVLHLEAMQRDGARRAAVILEAQRARPDGQRGRVGHHVVQLRRQDGKDDDSPDVGEGHPHPTGPRHANQLPVHGSQPPLDGLSVVQVCL